MVNKLIPTNSIWYKIKHFFKNIFYKGKSYSITEKNEDENELVKDESVFNDIFKAQFENNDNKLVLSDKLLYGELGISELNEKEVDEMKEYFTNDIYNIDKELLRIKEHILIMQQKLKQE